MQDYHPAAASDVLRYEILYTFGGVYMDVDLQLTAALDQLEVEDDLALCAFEDFTKRTRRNTSQVYHGKSAATHARKCFYAMNNIIATHKGSGFVALLRAAIGIAYGRMDNDPTGALRAYWQCVPNKATIDLTGPNLVREVQYQLSLGVALVDIPALCVDRVAAALAKAKIATTSQDREVVQDRAKAAEELKADFARMAELWPDDDPFYFAFWNWVWTHTYFPMHKVNWRTEASAKSDTKAAGKQ